MSADRVRAAEVAKMTSLSVRQIQQMAVLGKIPGAAKLGSVWTFDPAQIRAWIKQEEQKASQASNRTTSTNVVVSDWRGSTWPEAKIEEAFQQLVKRKRGSGLRRGGAGYR